MFFWIFCEKESTALGAGATCTFIIINDAFGGKGVAFYRWLWYNHTENWKGAVVYEIPLEWENMQ
jgi:hypothetical protein